VPSAPSSPAAPAPAGGTESPESQSGKAVSTAQSAPGDATPPETDLGTQEAQLARGSEDRTYGNRPTPATSTPNTEAAPRDPEDDDTKA
jgi:hypothetical protein